MGMNIKATTPVTTTLTWDDPIESHQRSKGGSALRPPVKVVTTTSSKLRAKASKPHETRAVAISGRAVKRNVCGAYSPRLADALKSLPEVRLNLAMTLLTSGRTPPRRQV